MSTSEIDEGGMSFLFSIGYQKFNEFEEALIFWKSTFPSEVESLLRNYWNLVSIPLDHPVFEQL